MVGSVNLNEPDLVGGEHDDGYGLGGEVRRLIKAIEGKEEAEKENEVGREAVDEACSRAGTGTES